MAALRADKEFQSLGIDQDVDESGSDENDELAEFVAIQVWCRFIERSNFGLDENGSDEGDAHPENHQEPEDDDEDDGDDEDDLSEDFKDVIAQARAKARAGKFIGDDDEDDDDDDIDLEELGLAMSDDEEDVNGG